MRARSSAKSRRSSSRRCGCPSASTSSRATAPLFGGELGLDSIDVLEIALALSRRYGVEIRADDAANPQIFATLRTLAAHVAEHRSA